MRFLRWRGSGPVGNQVIRAKSSEVVQARSSEAERNPGGQNPGWTRQDLLYNEPHPQPQQNHLLGCPKGQSPALDLCELTVTPSGWPHSDGLKALAAKLS